MINYLFRNILIHGSEPSRNERTAFCVIVAAFMILVAWLDPC